MPRVLQVLPLLESGGVERATLDLAIGLKKFFPYEPSYIASGGGALTDSLAANGVEHLYIPALASKNPGGLLASSYTLARFIQAQKIEIVHAHSRAPAWSAWLATRWTKCRFITTYHSCYSASNRWKQSYNSVMIRGERVLAISQFIYNLLRQKPLLVPHTKLRLVKEGIDVEQFAPRAVQSNKVQSLRQEWRIDPQQKIVLLPGRFVPRKGQEVLLKAAALLQNSNLMFVLLGNSGSIAYQKFLLTLSQQLGITQQVRMIKEVPPMSLAYSIADCVVIPSVNTPEAFGRVIAEAAAMERIVITSALGAAPEICLPHKTGFLVPPGDPCALAQAIKEALSLPYTQAKVMGACARLHVVENFSLSQMLFQTIKVYEEVHEKNSGH